ncbi:MAG TPA: hypothetical protein VGK32_10310 [Vicinamibacterales bacterium]
MRIEPVDVNHAPAETEELSLARQLRTEHKLTRSLVFGVMVLAVLLLAVYLVHLLLAD